MTERPETESVHRFHPACAALLVAALAGCAGTPSAVTPLGGEYYSVVREAPTSLTSVATLQAEASAVAKKFCAERKASVQVLTMRDSKGWSMAGNTPRVELQFSCVPNPPEPLPPKLGAREGAPAPLAHAASAPAAAPPVR